MRGVALGEFGSHMGREIGVLPEIEDLLLGRLVLDPELAVGSRGDLARERALTVFLAVVSHHLEPSLVGELKEAGCARPPGARARLETALERSLREKELEIDTRRGAGRTDALEHLPRQPLTTDSAE